jgi:hypothetical protein
MARIPNDLIGAAGVHYVASELSRRGLVALPTIRNAAAADILVWRPSSGRHAVLQVKTSQRLVKFWPVSKPENCLRGAHAYYVFVRWNRGSQRFGAFLVEADRVVRRVEQNLADQRRRERREFAFWALPEQQAEVDALRRQWEEWQP